MATAQMLLDLAKERNVEAWRDAMFSGQKINTTENRAVCIPPRARQRDAVIEVDGHNVVPDVQAVLAKMAEFAQKFAAVSGAVIRTGLLKILSTLALAAQI